MAVYDVQAFRSELRGDGARPNLFEIQLNLPVTGIASIGNAIDITRSVSMFARATSLPGSSIGVIPMGYFGRQIKIPGNVTYADWTVTIINDEDFTIRNSMEKWHNALNAHRGNVRDPNAYNSSQYAVDAYVMQYGKRGPNFGGPLNDLREGGAIKKYKMIGVWPYEISDIPVAWDSNNQVEEFSVTFAVQWWESLDITS